MKKIVSLLLVLVSLLSLTACGGNSAPTDTTTTPDNSTTAPVVSDNENTSTEPTTETAPEAEPFRFAGTWRQVQKRAEETETRYVLDEDGNVTSYIGYDDRNPFKYTFVKEEESHGEWYVDFKSDNGGKLSLTFTLVDGHYCIIEYAFNERDRQYFYREEDYADYNIVELTTENFAQYLDNSYNIWYQTDDYGEITYIFADTYPTFKEGLGLGSFFLGEVNHNYSYKMITYDPNTGEYTVGETVSTWECGYTTEFKFCAIGNYHRSWASAADIQKNDDGTYLLKEIETYEFIGAEKVIGKVFVPKGWNG
jgi:predicted small lipoprotein YifL